MAIEVLLLAAVLAGFTVLGKSYILMGHKGWQRLTFVSCVIAGAATAGISYYSHPYRWAGDIFNHAAAAVLITFVVIVYGRKLVQWIRAGFGEPAPAQSVPSGAGATAFGPTGISDEREPEEDDAARMPLATFWPRFWARCIDLALAYVLANLLIWFMPNMRNLHSLWGFVATIAIWLATACATVVAYETFWVSKTGTTPGKAWMGLSVRTPDGFIPETQAALRRSWLMLAAGLIFMIAFPYAQIFTARSAARTLKDGNSLKWDLAGRTFVHQHPVGKLRLISGAIVGALLVSAIVIMGRMAQTDMNQEIMQSVTRR